MSFRLCPKCNVDLVKDAHDDWHCGECGFVPDPSEEPFELQVLTARDITAFPDPPASDMLVGPLVIRGARTIIVADTGHGKTTLAGQLVSAALTGWDVFGYQGAGVGPALIIDLEQGFRSIKRALRDVGLHDREDVLYVSAPDGLALDGDEEHRAEVERIVEEHCPAIVVLDPFYKGHRGDANEERAVVDLMRYLDGLRARFGFALILPAHPRKDPKSNTLRKLTLHDVAGSGAIVRGAELVIGLERLSHGYAKLRILKDRDGDLSVGDEWPLVFTRGEGFTLKEETPEEDLEKRILELGSDGEWRISSEFASELTIRKNKAIQTLEKLAEAGHLEVAIGPPGRSARARCYRTVPADWEQSGTVGTVGTVEPGEPTVPPFPTVIGNCRDGNSDASALRTGTVAAVKCLFCEQPFRLEDPRAGAVRCPACTALSRGLVTEREADEMRLLARLRVGAA